jgi:hypothetical protein
MKHLKKPVPIISPKKEQFILFHNLLSAECLVAGGYLFTLPADPKNSLIFGLSLARLGLLAVFLLLALGFFAMAVIGSRRKSFASRQVLWLRQRPVLITLAVLFIAGFTLTILPVSRLPSGGLAFFERLLPLVVIVWAISLEFLAWTGIHAYRLRLPRPVEGKKLFLPAAITLGILLLVWILASATGLGNVPDRYGWRQMGSPLLAWQVWLSLLSGILFFFIDRSFPPTARRSRRLQIGVVVLIYLFAVLLWTAQPFQTAYTAPRVRPPNNEIYPYSDSMYYSAAAESVLTGNGLLGYSVVPRPMFITIWTYVFALAHGQFTGIVSLQIFLLALIPVLLYLIGSKLFDPTLGWVTALFAIFREVDAIQSTPYIPVSTSKLVLSDLPTLLALLLFAYLLILWLGKKDRPAWLSLICGGSLGFLMLFRTQTVIFLPLALLLIWLTGEKRFPAILRQGLLFLLGWVLILSPWVIRNYTLTHTFAFDDSNTQTSVLLQRYQSELDDDSGTDTINPQSASILQVVVKDPLSVARFVTTHFIRNEICALFVIPPQYINGDLDNLFNGTNFWDVAPLQLTLYQKIIILLNLILISLGIGMAYSRYKLTGLIPLLIQVTYSLSNGLARNSGGRYNVVVDWAGYFYLGAGVLAILMTLIKWKGRPVKEEPPVETVHPISRKVLVWCAAGLVLLGSFIPITEHLFPQRYPQDANATLQAVLKTNVDNAKEINALIALPGEEVIHGRELYPRYYRPGVGEGGSSWAAYAPLDFCRMGFLVVDSSSVEQVIVTVDHAPEIFPNRVDAFVIGKRATALVRGKPVEYLQADAIYLQTDPPVFLRGLSELPATCKGY